MLLLLLACTDKGAESAATTDSGTSSTTPTDAQDTSGNAGPACAPNDGAAVVFIFALPADSCSAEADPTSLTRIAVWQPAPLAAGTYDLSDPSVGSGYIGNVSISSGTITITGWEGMDADARISGHYELVDAGGADFHGAFADVPWCPSDTIMCG